MMLTAVYLFCAVGTDELIHHALQAIRGCLQGDQELTADNVAVSIVGVNQSFKIIEGADLQPYVRYFCPSRPCSVMRLLMHVAD
jgi:hypothetical protein